MHNRYAVIRGPVVCNLIHKSCTPMLIYVKMRYALQRVTDNSKNGKEKMPCDEA